MTLDLNQAGNDLHFPQPRSAAERWRKATGLVAAIRFDLARDSASGSSGKRRLKDCSMIHVCSLARLHDTVASTGARHVVSLLGVEDNLRRPATVLPENHLWLQLHDISAPLEGFVMPQSEHIETLIAFVRRWRREAPLVVHCYAGVSRSTAAAG
jgi:hypothetical protein